jgi:hypothetical protein
MDALYDEFGNYIGPELQEDNEQQQVRPARCLPLQTPRPHTE